MKRRLAVLLLTTVVQLGGCAGITLVEGGRHTVAATGYSVDAQMPWNRIKTGDMEIWTVDGPVLQALRFMPPREDGDLIDPDARADEGKGARYRVGMAASEVAEAVVDTMSAAGFVDVRATGLRPFEFGGHAGFRFELSMRSVEGLAMEATVAGAEVERQLMFVLYMGTSTHYYPKLLPAVEAILASLRFA